MSTGYTASIKDGISFEKFAMRCARNFGACIMQRGESLSSEFKMDKPSSHYSKKLFESEYKLNEFINMGDCELIHLYNEEKQNETERCENVIKKAQELENKYREMLVEVDSWSPPTVDHNALKEFMRTQILESIKFDCNTDYYYGILREVQLQPFGDWLLEKIKRLKKDVVYLKKEKEKDHQMTNERNKWKQQLVDSLKKR